MNFTIRIKDTQTGHEGDVVVDHDDVGQLEFMWTDGNYGCDCNRGMFLHGSDKHFDCGDSRFQIVRITDAEGKDIQL